MSTCCKTFIPLRSTNKVYSQVFIREVTDSPFIFFELRVARSQDLFHEFPKFPMFQMFPTFPILPTLYICYCILFNSLHYMNQEFIIVTPEGLLNIFSLGSSHSAHEHNKYKHMTSTNRKHVQTHDKCKHITCTNR